MEGNRERAAGRIAAAAMQKRGNRFKSAFHYVLVCCYTKATLCGAAAQKKNCMEKEEWNALLGAVDNSPPPPLSPEMLLFQKIQKSTWYRATTLRHCETRIGSKTNLLNSSRERVPATF